MNLISRVKILILTCSTFLQFSVSSHASYHPRISRHVKIGIMRDKLRRQSEYCWIFSFFSRLPTVWKVAKQIFYLWFSLSFDDGNYGRARLPSRPHRSRVRFESNNEEIKVEMKRNPIIVVVFSVMEWIRARVGFTVGFVFKYIDRQSIFHHLQSTSRRAVRSIYLSPDRNEKFAVWPIVKNKLHHLCRSVMVN